MLMLRYDLDAETAYQLLVRWSSSTNVKLRVIAESIVAASGHGPHPVQDETAHPDPSLAPAVAAIVRDVVVGGGARPEPG